MIYITSKGLSNLKYIIRTGGATPWWYKEWLLPPLTVGRKSPASFLQSRKLSSHDEETIILSSANPNDFNLFLFSWLQACFPRAHIDLNFGLALNSISCSPLWRICDDFN